MKNTIQKDFADIKGQYHVKRALEVAVVGGHDVLLIGGQKSGKTMIKERINTISDTPISIYEYLPCPCGHFTDPKKECFCTPFEILKHLAKIPYNLDTIDIHVEVPVLTYNQMMNKRTGETSADIKARVLQAKKNYKPTEKDLEKEGEELLKMAILEIGFNARSYYKVINVAGTIAQMEGKKTIEASHISEAIGYRSLDRNLWA